MTSDAETLTRLANDAPMKIALIAAPFVNSAPTLPTLFRDEEFKTLLHGPEQREKWKAQKAAQRALAAMERRAFPSMPVHQRFCEAVANFAESAERSANPDLVKAIDAVRRAASGWETDPHIMSAILTAIADEWAIRWTKGNPDRP